MKKVISIFFLLITLFIYQSTDGKNGFDFFRIFPNWSSIQDKHSELNDPELIGPDRLCNVFGSVIGTFSGGGDPSTDTYQWTILGPEGQLLFTRPGGAFPSINYTFGLLGTHKVELIVSRGGIPLNSFSKNVELIKGPEITLEPAYLICENQEIELQAIDPSSSNFSNYQFEWKDASGNVLSTSNNLKTSKSGKYSVSFLLINSSGNPECVTSEETTVSNSENFSIISSTLNVCPDGSITFETNPPVIGEWSLQKIGDPSPISLGTGNSKTLFPALDLTGTGDYQVRLVVPNPNNPSCTLEDSETFSYNPLPEFELVSAVGASGCLVPDGAIRIKMLTPVDNLILEDEGQSFGALSAGDIVEFPELESGAYTIIGILGGCVNSLGSVVPLVNTPVELEFELTDIQPEYCTDLGKENGSFLVKLINGELEGSYRIKTLRGVVIKNDVLPLADEFRIDIPGGKYYFEVFDKDSCNLPKNEEFEVPGLDQVSFSISESLSICQSYDLIPQTTQSLEFTLISPDQTASVLPAGEAFSLTQSGIHTLIGKLPGQSKICPTRKEFTVELVQPIDFEPKLISEDCTVGNRTFEADIFGADPSTAIFLWKNENGETVGTGQFLFLPPSAFGEYTLEVQPAGSQSCPIPPKKFLVKEPVLSVEVSLTSTKLCEFGPRAILSVTTTNPEEVTNIVWRRFDDAGQIIELDEFKDRNEIIAEVEGIYEASVYSIIPAINKDCELGRNTFNLDLTTEKVSFTIPDQLSICDPYPLIPQSNEPLSFILTYPDGTTQEKEWNEAFEISMEGTYTILGFNPDVTFPLCPEQKSFDVKINQPVEFNPTLLNLTCEGTYEFFATLSNYTPDEVDFFWRDAAGTLLGTDQTIFLSQYGTFELDVQPKGSIPCADTKLTFEAPTPVLSLPVDMLQDPYCPDQPNTRLELISTFETVTEIQWWFTDISGIKNQLISESNKREIVIIEEGTYEAIILNQYNCILGTDQRLVLKSQDTVRPEVQVSYQICPRYEIAETINPGSFASYEWYFENNLVSTNTTFKPAQIGQHQLIVTSTEGCRYQTSFLTEEECEFKVVVPSAMIPGNPDKNFLIYTNYLIDDLEIWIFNKWGQIIYHCKNSNLISEQSTCAWDGYFDGKKVPPGSYAYRMNFKNLEKNISQFQLGSIMVIE